LCHWPDCEKEVPASMWGCKSHWFSLPNFIQKRIWATYKPGQEISKTPSESYLVVARGAQKWIELSKKYGAKMATEQFENLINEKGWPDQPIDKGGDE